MIGWRVTRYDPARRDAQGRYVHPDWTSIADVGRSFGGEVLTFGAYLRVESAYVDTVVAFHAEQGSPALFARAVEPGPPAPPALRGEALPAPPAEGAVVEPAQLPMLVRSCLRELFWCRVEALDGACSVHFGYDLYLYLAGRSEAPRTRALARGLGLFVEPFVSPYLPEA